MSPKRFFKYRSWLYQIPDIPHSQKKSLVLKLARFADAVHRGTGDCQSESAFHSAQEIS